MNLAQNLRTGLNRAQLHSVVGTQLFLYKSHTDTVMIVHMDSRGQFVDSENQNKVAARALWDSLVKIGWTTKRIKT